MPAVNFHFHAALNDFIPEENRHTDIHVSFQGHETVKHLIEALGIPHTEVDAILVNGVSVDFAFQPANADRVDIFPVPSLLGDPVQHLQPVVTGKPRFVLDGHLGKLASYLRLMGFDVLYQNDYEDHELAEISSQENRILLTRDRGLLKRSEVQYGYLIRGKFLDRQVIEVLRRYNLVDHVRPFSRCARCNGELTPVSKVEVYDRLEPKTKLYYDDFRRCDTCGQIYWKGSHFERMEKDISVLIDQAKMNAEDARY